MEKYFFLGETLAVNQFLTNGGGVNRCIVLVEKPGSLNHLRPLCLERLHELAQDYHSVVGIDGGAICV